MSLFTDASRVTAIGAFPSLLSILGKVASPNPQRPLAMAAGTAHVSGPPSSEPVFV
jgi:hypothetical protein